MYDIDLSEMLREAYDPARGGWGVIALDPMERALAVPHPSYGAHFSLAGTVTMVLGMLLLSAISMILALVGKNISSLMAVNWGRFITMAICGCTGLYLMAIVLFVVAIDASASDIHCNAVFVVSAFFWLLTKALLHLWFNEKLYIRRFMKDLEFRRWNNWYLINTFGLGTGFCMMLYISARYYYAEISSPECRIGITHQSVLIWVDIYLFLLTVYMSVSFSRLLPPINIPCFGRHSPPRLNPRSLRPVIYIPPAITPPKDGDLACNTKEVDALIVEQTSRKERNKSIILCVLYIATSVLPLTIITFLIYTGRHARWWWYVCAVALDCLLAGVVVGLYEGRPWREIGSTRLQEAKKRNKKAMDLGICVECGWDEKEEEERARLRNQQGQELVESVGYGVPWDQVDVGV